ncbi:MAG: DUF1700 domain-containing protein [Anaerovoracaceae bacterium]
MNRIQFMNRLAAELRSLPKAEIEAAMEYYNEYFDEAGLEGEEEAIKDLGSPTKIGTQIKADYAVKQLDGGMWEKKSARKEFSAIWWVILGLFAAPIALPIAIALGAVAVAVFATILALLVSAVVTLGCVCLVGIVLVIVGTVGLASSGSAGLVIIGGGLVMTAITAVMCVGIVIGGKKMIRFMARKIRELNEKRRIKKLAKEEEKND